VTEIRAAAVSEQHTGDDLFSGHYHAERLAVTLSRNIMALVGYNMVICINI